MGWMAPLAAVAGDIIGGMFADKGQAAANRTNLRIAKENRDFQERMSSTAYQRATQDLEAAGLNRIIALGSPSSSPSGAMLPVQNERAQTGKGLSRAASSALDAKTKVEAFKQIQANVRNTDMDTDLKHAQNMESQQRYWNLGKMNQEIQSRINLINAQQRTAAANAVVAEQEAKLAEILGAGLPVMDRLLGVGGSLLGLLGRGRKGDKNTTNTGRGRPAPNTRPL